MFVNIGSVFYCFNRNVANQNQIWLAVGYNGLKMASGQLLFCALVLQPDIYILFA